MTLIRSIMEVKNYLSRKIFQWSNKGLKISKTYQFFIWAHLSTSGRWHNSNANRNPQIGLWRRRKLYSVQTAQLWYSTTVLQLSSVTAQLYSSEAWLCLPGRGGSARVCFTCSCAALLWQDYLYCVSSSWWKAAFSLECKGKVHIWSQKGIDLCR